MMKPSHRRKARKLALQAMYQMMVGGEDLEKVIQHHLSTAAPSVDADYFTAILRVGYAGRDQADQIIASLADRPLKDLTPIELNVLRLAYYELEHRTDVPALVVINEALELNKIFGTEEGFRFVNAILDKMAKVIRPKELS